MKLYTVILLLLFSFQYLAQSKDEKTIGMRLTADYGQNIKDWVVLLNESKNTPTP